jgi:hypothetical protein
MLQASMSITLIKLECENIIGDETSTFVVFVVRAMKSKGLCVGLKLDLFGVGIFIYLMMDGMKVFTFVNHPDLPFALDFRRFSGPRQLPKLYTPIKS